MSDASPGTQRVPASAMVYADIYLPEALARTVAERAEAARITPNELLASLIEHFVAERAGEPPKPPIADADAESPEDIWDAPDMVRRIVPLPEDLAHAVARLAAAWQRPVNALIREELQAALGDNGNGSDSEQAP